MAFRFVGEQKITFSHSVIAFGHLLMLRESYTIYHDLTYKKLGKIRTEEWRY
jgi:hypothetical protein